MQSKDKDIVMPHRPTLQEYVNEDCKLCKGSGLIYKPILQPKSIGRNDICFCGSGKKYKKCCWHQYKSFGRRGALQYCSCLSMEEYNRAIEDYKLAMEAYKCQVTDTNAKNVEEKTGNASQ